MSEQLPLWRRLRRRWWYGVARAALRITNAIPLDHGRRLCRVLARLALCFRGSERALARANLEAVFPDQSDVWRERFLLQSVDALGDNLHASLALERHAAGGFLDVVEELGPGGHSLPTVLQSLQTRGRGVLLLTAHLGCWELLGAWLAARLERPAVVTATVRNPAVDRLLQDRRRAMGLDPLPREAGVRPLLRALSRGAVVGVLVDQNTGASAADVPFLGRPAPTPMGPFRLALRRNVPLVPAAMVRENEKWVVRHLAPIEPQHAADALDLAARCNRALESLIRRTPTQWIWFHDRWNLEVRHRSH